MFVWQIPFNGNRMSVYHCMTSRRTITIKIAKYTKTINEISRAPHFKLGFLSHSVPLSFRIKISLLSPEMKISQIYF